MLGKVAASIADQGVASSTNFILNVLLARWLTPRDYGIYSVCWATLLVLAGFHNALVLEPMTIVGPADYRHRLDAYLHSNGRLNWIISLALSAVALVVAFAYREPAARPALMVLSACVPGYLLLLLARRKQYVLNRPLRALRYSVVYAVLMFVFIFAWRLSGRLTPLTALSSFGIAGLAGYLAIAKSPTETIPMAEVARAHWRYGKWLIASAMMAIGAPDLQTILLSMLVDLKSAGALRALMNFVLPLSQLVSVLSIYALPRLSERSQEWGPAALLRRSLFFPALIAAASAAYLGVLLLFAPRLEHLLYKGKMQAYLQWMLLLAASTFVICVAGSFSTLLRAVRNSQHQFIAGVAGTVVGVGSAFCLLRAFGFPGALWSMLAANLATAMVIGATFVWLVRRRNV